MDPVKTFFEKSQLMSPVRDALNEAVALGVTTAENFLQNNPFAGVPGQRLVQGPTSGPLAPPKLRRQTAYSVARTQSGKEPAELQRERTGNPYVDGLVGIEANPGPRKTAKQKMSALKKRMKKSKGVSSGALYPTQARPLFGKTSVVSAPVGLGSYTRQGHTWFRHGGSRVVDGVQCTVLTGRQRCRGVVAVTDTGIKLRLGGFDGGSSFFSFCNPGAMCRAANYNNVETTTALGLMSSAFRKFRFNKLKFCYTPTSINTSVAAQVCFAYISDSITLNSGECSVDRLTRFETSVVGPVWAPMELDATPYLDKSKWFEREIDSAGITGLELQECVQGLLAINGNDTVVGINTGLEIGILWVEYEVLLYTLGPGDFSSGPSLDKNTKHSLAEISGYLAPPSTPVCLDPQLDRDPHGPSESSGAYIIVRQGKDEVATPASTASGAVLSALLRK